MRLLSRERLNLNIFRPRSTSRGAVVVEFAVVLPLMLTLLFGIIEFGWVFKVCQVLTSAAREGCRTAVLAGSTNQDILNRVDMFMQQARIEGYSTEITRATEVDPTETVTVKVPYASVSLLGGFFGAMDFNLQGNTAMLKEGADVGP